MNPGRGTTRLLVRFVTAFVDMVGITMLVTILFYVGTNLCASATALANVARKWRQTPARLILTYALAIGASTTSSRWCRCSWASGSASRKTRWATS